MSVQTPIQFYAPRLHTRYVDVHTNVFGAHTVVAADLALIHNSASICSEPITLRPWFQAKANDESVGRR